MLNMNINMSFSSTSTNSDNEVVASFNASYSGAQSLYISVSITDGAAYAANKAKADADFADFTAQVLATIADIEDGPNQ